MRKKELFVEAQEMMEKSVHSDMNLTAETQGSEEDTIRTAKSPEATVSTVNPALNGYRLGGIPVL